LLKGLTPLYHACLSGKNPNVAELLLGDQAEIGVVDSQGWQEIHQVFEHAMFPRNKRTGSIKTRGLSPQ
jgi:ankyrin repeat protein